MNSVLRSAATAEVPPSRTFLATTPVLMARMPMLPACSPVLDARGFTMLSDLMRRCPAVDPFGRDVLVCLGCAAENPAQAALAHGQHASVRFDAAGDVVRVAFSSSPSRASPLFQAIPARQCTRGHYDGPPLSSPELALLELAGKPAHVGLLLRTERTAVQGGLSCVIQGNTALMADPAFVGELRSWLRFNGSDAVRNGQGLSSASSGAQEHRA
jgi:hypothetical protein